MIFLEQLLVVYGERKIINMAKIKENLNSILSVLLFLMVGVIAFIIGKIILFSSSVFTNDYAIVLLEMLLPIIIP